MLGKSNTTSEKDPGPSVYLSSNDLLFINQEIRNGISNCICFNTVAEQFICIDFIEETESNALIGLWDGVTHLGTIPVFKKNIDDQTLETIAASIWNEFHRADSAMGLLSRKRVGEIARFQSPLGLIAEIAASLASKTAALIYAERKQQEGDKAVEVPEWFNSYRVPENLLPIFTRLRINTLHWFNLYPEEAYAIHNDYWRTTVYNALSDLEDQATKISNLSRKQLRRVLNNQVFGGDDFTGDVHAMRFCGRVLARNILTAVNFASLSTKEMEKFLEFGGPQKSKSSQLPLLMFEQQAILPFGEVEEQIRMSWQYPGESDLEIINGGSPQLDLALSPHDVVEGLRYAIRWWREKENQLQKLRASLLDDPQACFAYMRGIFHERRLSRRYMRAYYGIDMARRRMLRKAHQPRTAEETARRAFYYGNASALEASAAAGHFTFCYIRDEVLEAGETLSNDLLNQIVMVSAKAAAGVMEALPLFHCAILERAPHPAIREIELYVLSGFAGAHISLRRYPRLRNALTRKEMLEQLPEAIARAVSERRLGETLIRGRNSLRNRVARFLESYNRQTVNREYQYSSDLLESGHYESATSTPTEVMTERFEAFQEAKAKLSEKIRQADLTPRERSVLELKLEGHSQKEIASLLNITVGSVKQLRARAYKKLRT